MVLILLVPVSIKLAHFFEHENHDSCNITSEANFHECETDCPLNKYNLQQYDIKSESFEFKIFSIDNFEAPTLVYNFFYTHLNSTLSLRGPPFLV